VWSGETLYTSNPIKTEFVCGYYIGTTWVTATAYAENDQVMPVTENGLVYYASTAGTTDDREPIWTTTIGDTVSDGTVVWTCIGKAVPEPIRQAIKVSISDMFEYRETDYFGGSHNKLKTFENLLFPFKLFSVIK